MLAHLGVTQSLSAYGNDRKRKRDVYAPLRREWVRGCGAVSTLATLALKQRPTKVPLTELG